MAGPRRSTLALFALRGVPQEAAVPTYDIEVTRDGGFWLIQHASHSMALPRTRPDIDEAVKPKRGAQYATSCGFIPNTD
jgi:hypothetical protein